MRGIFPARAVSASRASSRSIRSCLPTALQSHNRSTNQFATTHTPPLLPVSSVSISSLSLSNHTFPRVPSRLYSTHSHNDYLARHRITMNDACCSRPPAKSDYEPLGKYETLKDGMKTYVIGPEDATTGVLMIYDIFAYSQQQRLGADIVAANMNARVYIPDFFRGEKVDQKTVESASPEERGKIIGGFFQGPGNFEAATKALPVVLAELKEKTPSAKKWATLGFCWGGIIAAMTSGPNAVGDASGSCHPGRLNNDQARGFTIPHICLSAGEDGTEKDWEEYKKALGESKVATKFEVFEDQVHGWMAARGDLSKERVQHEFNRGYDLVTEFFKANL